MLLSGVKMSNEIIDRNTYLLIIGVNYIRYLLYSATLNNNNRL